MSGQVAYDIIGLEGRGRFGAVYRGLGPDGEVALKRGADGWASLKDDKLAAAAVAGASPLLNLPTSWLTHQGESWAVLDWVDGADLARFNQAIPVRATLEIASEIAGVLAALRPHAMEVPWPPDLRPNHVRVTSQGALRLVDLWQGRLDPSVEAHQEWLAPEVLRNRDPAKADVYALGVLVHHMLGGTALGPPDKNMSRHKVQVSLALDSLVERDVPEPVVGLISDMLSYRERSRPEPAGLAGECREIGEDVGGPTLVEWAAKAVNAVGPDATLDADSRIGARVSADVGDTEDPAPSSPAPSSPAPVESVAPSEQRARSPRSPIESLPPTEDATPTVTPEADVIDGEDPPTAETELASAAMIRAVQEARNPVDETGDGPSLQDAELPFRSAISEEILRSVPPLAEQPPPDVSDSDEEGVPVWIWGALAGAVLLMLLTGGAYIVFGAGGTPSPEPAVAPTPAAPAPTAVPAADPAPPVEPAPAPENPGPPPEPAPAAQPSVATPAPVPDVAPDPAAAVAAPPPRATVTLAGDKASVWLVGPTGQRFALPGPISAGTYDVQAAFDGAESAAAGSIFVPGQGTVVLECNQLFARCTVQ